MAELLERLQEVLGSRYRIERELGRGGMASVYLAEDLKHHRRVAVKVLSPEIAAAIGPERFLREVVTVAGLQHPHVLPLHDSGQTGGLLYYVMPYVAGESLRQRLERERQLPLEDALRIAREVAEALDYAHRQGVLHRDIKPENILLESGHAVVADFGIARAIDQAGGEKLTGTGVALGTPAYMSPEQAAGSRDIDGRSDLYSLGCVLYEMLAGQPPFTGPTLEAVLHQHLTADPPRVTNIRPGVTAVAAAALHRILAKTPADRYTTAAQLAAVLADAAMASAARVSSSPHPSSGTQSIAVLPFTNMSADPENEYFSDGVTEEIINALAGLTELRVAARTSTFSFKGKHEHVRVVGEKLEVSNILEGSVRRIGNRVRITAQLINVADGFHLWSESYDRELTDVFAIQDDIARAIVGALTPRLARTRSQPLVKRYTENREAYHLYLKGRHAWNQRTRESITRAMEYFQRALAEDVGYALPYAGLADSYLHLGFYGMSPPRDVMPRAKAAALKALEIDESLPEAHASLALVKTHYDWNWREAEAEFRRALALDPGYSTAHHWYAADYLMPMGREEEAIAEIQVACELDPLSPIIYSAAGWLFYHARRFDRAVEECKKALELDAGYGPAHFFLGLAYLQQRRYDHAREAWERAKIFLGGSPIPFAMSAVTSALSGAREDAERVIRDLVELAPKSYVSAYHVAAVHAALGDHDQALQWLERAHEERSNWLVNLTVDPLFDEVRSAPRCSELIRKMAGT